jgi:hypothetical protein
MKDEEIKKIRRAALGKLLVEKLHLPDLYEYSSSNIRKKTGTAAAWAVCSVVSYLIWRTNLFAKGNGMWVFTTLVSIAFAIFCGYQAYIAYTDRRAAYRKWHRYVRLQRLMRRYNLEDLYLQSSTMEVLKAQLETWRESLQKDSRSTPSVRRLLNEDFDGLVREIESVD